jgi:inosine-uridine nucleoside N-ribohydrolase
MTNHVKIPVILDTDIGDDIDDTWALGLLLLQPNLDILLITTVSEYPAYDRARLVHQFLSNVGRSDIPVVSGLVTKQGHSNQSSWLERWDTPLSTNSAVQSMVNTVLQHPSPVTVITIGPLTNLASAYTQNPKIADRINWVAMAGSYRECSRLTRQPILEYNIVQDIPSAQLVFGVEWASARLAPLDVCNVVYLNQNNYDLIREHTSEPVTSIVGNYLEFLTKIDPDFPTHPGDPDISTILYDTVAVYIAGFTPNDTTSDQLLQWETVHLGVTGLGQTRPMENALPIRVATGWKDLPRFTEYLLHKYLQLRV